MNEFAKNGATNRRRPRFYSDPFVRLMSNLKIANILSQTARLLEYREGSSFVSRELSDIASRVRTLDAPLALFSDVDLENEEQVAELDAALNYWFRDFSHDGVWLLRETILTLTNPMRDDLINASSPATAELLKIISLDVDAVRFLRRAMGIRSIDALKRSCAAGTLAQSGRFSERQEHDILEELQRLEEATRTKCSDDAQDDECEQIAPYYDDQPLATDDPLAMFHANADALADAIIGTLAEPLRASLLKTASDFVSKDAINLARDQARDVIGKARRFFTSPTSPNYARLRREEEERNRAQAERRAVQEAEERRETAISRPLDVIKVGALARRREIIGKLEFLIITDNPVVAFERVNRSEFVKARLETTDRWAKFVLAPDFFDMPYNNRPTPTIELTFYAVSEFARGAMELALTSTKRHWQELQRRAHDKGWRLTLFGLYDGPRRITSTQTYRIYEKLGMIEPPICLRHADVAQRWFEAGSPALLELDDLRADLHMHTTHSDGVGSIDEMIDYALELGLDYIAITDHTQNVPGVTGLGDVELLRVWDMIDGANETLKRDGVRFHVLKGAEVDILEDGGLDLKDETLKRADWIIASIHVARDQNREIIERRYMDAFRSPYVDVVAHPTERVIGKEAPMKVELEFLCQNAKKYGKALELNSQPRRLDLPTEGLILAKRYGVPIAISTDAHAPDQMNYLRFGVEHAQRAGLTADDVLNVKSYAELVEWRTKRIGNATSSGAR